MSMRSGRNSGAFTLVELLIASAIFVVVMLSLYSAFQTGIISYRRLDTSFAAYQTARAALNRLEADLKNSFAYSDSGGKSRFSGTSDSLDFFSAIESYDQGKAQSDVCRIKYSFEDNTLKRASLRGLEALEENLSAPQGNLAVNINKLSFEYLYIADSTNSSYERQDSWPLAGKEEEQAPILPSAIKITLFFSATAGSDNEFVKIIAIPIQAQRAFPSGGAVE